MKVEITGPLSLSPAEERLTSLHSLYNALCVLYGRLEILTSLLKDDRCLANSLALCRSILASITAAEDVRALVARITQSQGLIWSEVKVALDGLPEETDRAPIEASVDALESVFAVLAVRLKELLEREQTGAAWIPHSIATLVENLHQLFAACVKNSGGRYGIVYTKDQQGPTDYLLSLEIRGVKPDVVTMPPVLQDCFRDLLANARKYTLPGGCICGSLLDDSQRLELVVSDTGRGIPEPEITEVVQFGIRGSNTRPGETKGGGYGLTKAYHVCRQLKGRMWIDSQLDAGTTVTLSLPRPEP